MSAAGFAGAYEACRLRVEEALEACFQEEAPYGRLLEAMRYSLLAGGKRVRPILVLKFCEAAGGDPQKALPLACAVEMLHTYSLIHDDLPCMDNDDLRRGRPTNHKVYGEFTATLAGDALQAAAFRTVLTAPLSAEARAACGAALAEAAAEHGICGGQYLDMEAEGRAMELEELTLTHSLKTAAMLRASAVMGVLAAQEGATPERLACAQRYAEALGLAFQIRDDMLDRIAATDDLGKTAGSDKARGKRTFADLLGLEACDRLVTEHTERAKAALREGFSNTEFLEQLADSLAQRVK